MMPSIMPMIQPPRFARGNEATDSIDATIAGKWRWAGTHRATRAAAAMPPASSSGVTPRTPTCT